MCQGTRKSFLEADESWAAIGWEHENILFKRRLMAWTFNRKSPDLCLLEFYVILWAKKWILSSEKTISLVLGKPPERRKTSFLIAFTMFCPWLESQFSSDQTDSNVALFAYFFSIKQAPSNVIKSIIFRTCLCLFRFSWMPCCWCWWAPK